MHSWSGTILRAAMIILISSLSFGVGRATTTVRFDAAFWRDLDSVGRLYFVQGLIEGYQSGFSDGDVTGHKNGLDEMWRVNDEFLLAHVNHS